MWSHGQASDTVTTAPVRADSSAASMTRNPRTESIGSTGRSPVPRTASRNAFVVPAVVAALRRDRRDRAIARVDAAPSLGRVLAEPGIVRAQAGEELVLLGVAVLLHVLTAETADPEPRARSRGDQRRPQSRPHAVDVIDGDEGRILHLAAGPAPVHLGEHPASPTEQDQALVHEVRPEIAMRATGLLGGLAPLVADDAPSLEPRLEAVDLAEGAARQERPHGQEVTVPAPVLVDGQDPPGALGGLEQRLGFGDVHRDRLVDDDVPPGLERADPDRDVGPVRGHDHDHLDVAVVEELVHGRDDRRLRGARRPPAPAVPGSRWRWRPAAGHRPRRCTARGTGARPARSRPCRRRSSPATPSVRP